MSMSDEFRKLQQLFQEGVLTEDEFKQAKATVLATHSAPQTSEADSRAREQLDQFKCEFASADELEMRSLLMAAEDLLTHICGGSRFKQLLKATDDFDRYKEWSKDSSESYQNRQKWLVRLGDEGEELKSRVAGIEHRK